MALFGKHEHDSAHAHERAPHAHDGPGREEPGRDEPGKAPQGEQQSESRDEPALGTGPSPEVERAAPDEPTELPARSWWAVLRRTGREFLDDDLPDRAAALTYYGVLSLFPALLLLVSLLGVIGESATRAVLDDLQKLAPGAVRDLLGDAVRQLRDSGGTSGVMAVVGLVLAVWSASGYVAAFIRASNIVYDLPEGRPVWKLTPLRIVLTVTLMVLLAVNALIVVFTGPLAERAGDAIGAGDLALTVWSIAKWPVLLVLVILMIALLFWRAPNVRGPGFRWLSPGSALAVLLWLIASGGFAVYVANFASYNKTYGTLAGVIVFLIWLWLSNLAILLGLEFDAELARQRAISGGMPEEEEPYVEPRDTRTWPRRRPAKRSRSTGRHA
ncbi:YihY/virulence factor BrkB family protein [Streptomyces arenae]|nr:YihY/virulence factor BrkB family protein [Streptomyces arenae]